MVLLLDSVLGFGFLFDFVCGFDCADWFLITYTLFYRNVIVVIIKYGMRFTVLLYFSGVLAVLLRL